MVSIQNGMIGDIPYLLAEKEELAGKPLPLFIFIHGYTSAKEHNLHFAYTLAEKGMRVILPDALHHGERLTADSPENRDFDFWNIVFQGIKDVKTILEWGKDKGIVLDEQIALGGTSMGAIITYASLLKYPEISLGCTLMGTPSPEEYARWQIANIKKMGRELPLSSQEIEMIYGAIRTIDLSQNMERLNNRPLFIWHSEIDQVIPFQFAKPYVDQLIQKNEKSFYMNDKTSGHKVSRSAYLNAVDWVLENISVKKETV